MNESLMIRTLPERRVRKGFPELLDADATPETLEVTGAVEVSNKQDAGEDVVNHLPFLLTAKKNLTKSLCSIIQHI